MRQSQLPTANPIAEVRDALESTVIVKIDLQSRSSESQ